MDPEAGWEVVGKGRGARARSAAPSQQAHGPPPSSGSFFSPLLKQAAEGEGVDEEEANRMLAEALGSNDEEEDEQEDVGMCGLSGERRGLRGSRRRSSKKSSEES